MSTSPTVVLVQGAFADGVSWSPVAMRLQGSGVDVRVPAIDARSLDADASYVRAFVEQIPGPVLLVGHSYGATVAGIAGGARNVRGLVFVSGYVLDEDESAGDVHRRFPEAEAVPFFEHASYPDLHREDISVAVDEFPFVTALGVPADEAAVLAVSQRPLAASILEDTARAASWRTTACWGIVSANDRTINPDAVRWGLERAGARRVLELPAPHLVMHTHPGEVAEFVLEVLHELAG